MLLPVSNLTNLLALGRLPGSTTTAFAALTCPPALAWVLVTTPLWAARCRAAGVEVSWGRFVLRGLLVVPLLLLAGVTALWRAAG